MLQTISDEQAITFSSLLFLFHAASQSCISLIFNALDYLLLQSAHSSVSNSIFMFNAAEATKALIKHESKKVLVSDKWNIVIG